MRCPAAAPGIDGGEEVAAGERHRHGLLRGEVGAVAQRRARRAVMVAVTDTAWFGRGHVRASPSRR